MGLLEPPAPTNGKQLRIRLLASALYLVRVEYLLYIHLYSPERQQQQVKEAPNIQQQQNKQKRKKLRSKRAN